MKPQHWGYVFAGVLTLAIYANSLDNPFHYDDVHSIVDNPHVRNLTLIPWYFVAPTAFSADPENAMYRPLLLATFAGNYAISGYEVWSYHLLALLLHLACALLVGIVGQKLLRDQWAGLFAAALFAVHPINTEPVNYISSRSEILAAFFFLLGFYAYLNGGPRKWLYVAGFFAAGLLSKSTMVVFPLVLVAYEGIVRRHLPRREKGLFSTLGLVAGGYILMVWSLLAKATVGEPVRPYDQQIWTQVKAMVFYIKMLFWPTAQSVDHQFLLSDSLSDPIAATAAGMLVSLVLLALYHRDRHPIPLFALTWSFIALAPASLVPLNVLVNEHRLYLPAAAFAIVIAYGGLQLRSRVGNWQICTIALLILTAGSWATIERNRVWQDEYALWGDAADKAPLMARPFIYLGGAYMRDGRAAEAVAAFEHVVRRDPHYTLAYINLSELYQGQGRYDLAVNLMEKAVVINAGDADLWGDLAKLYRARQDWPRALAAYDQAVKLAPQDPALRNNLGNTYQVLGRPKEALKQHEQALLQEPDDPETLLNLGNAHLMMKDSKRAFTSFQRAKASYQRALAGQGENADSWFNLGYVFERLGDVERGLAAYDRAVALDAGYAAQVSARRKMLGGHP